MAGAFRRSKLVAMMTDRVKEDGCGHSVWAGSLIQADLQNANLFEMRERSCHASLEEVGEHARDRERSRAHAGEGFP